MLPPISVVIPSCDRPIAVQDAVSSVRAQAMQPKEIVVVDNGVDRIVESQLPGEVTLLRMEPYIGVSSARNEGARVATGEYVAFLDDDDAWAPDYLEYMVEAIANAEETPDLLIGRKDRVKNGGRVVYKCLKHAADLMPTLLYRNHGVGGINIVVRRKKFFEVGGYDANLQNAEDRALALDFLQADAWVVCVPEAAAIMGEEQETRLRDRGNKYPDRKYFYEKYKDIMPIDIRLWNRAIVSKFRIKSSSNSVMLPVLWSRYLLDRLVFLLVCRQTRMQ